jgi:hypothetical protein
MAQQTIVIVFSTLRLVDLEQISFTFNQFSALLFLKLIVEPISAVVVGIYTCILVMNSLLDPNSLPVEHQVSLLYSINILVVVIHSACLT